MSWKRVEEIEIFRHDIISTPNITWKGVAARQFVIRFGRIKTHIPTPSDSHGYFFLDSVIRRIVHKELKSTASFSP